MATTNRKQTLQPSKKASGPAFLLIFPPCWILNQPGKNVAIFVSFFLSPEFEIRKTSCTNRQKPSELPVPDKQRLPLVKIDKKKRLRFKTRD